MDSHTGEGHELRFRDGLAQAHQHHADFTRARQDGANAGHERNQHGDHRLFHAVAAARQMGAGNMPGLVRHDADQFVGRSHPQQDAGAYVDICRLHRESIDGRIAYQIGLHGFGGQARGAGQRRFITAQHFLGLGVAQDAKALGVRRDGIGQQRGGKTGGKGQFAQKGLLGDNREFSYWPT